MRRFRALLAPCALAVVLGLACLSSAQAAIVHAGPTATGNGSGSDWNNIADFDTLSPVRGNTYYLQDGTYVGKTFDTPVSGTTLITVKKATASDHGTDTGWVAAYGDGQAVFGTLTFQTSYFTIDGATRNESNWQQTSSYGFKISDVFASTFAGSSATNITVRYADIGGPTGQICTGSTPSNGFYVVFGGLNNWTISRNHIHNVELPFRIVQANNWTVEHNHIGPSWAKEAISSDDSSGWIIRHNRFFDNLIFPPPACQHGGDGGTADIWTRVANGANDNWQIYGNVFGDTGTYSPILRTNAVVLGNYWSGPSDRVSNWKVYNNVFYNISGGMNLVKLGDGTGNVVANNLWYKSGELTGSIGIIGADTLGPSWCYSTPFDIQCNGLPATVVFGSEDPFVDAASFDFRLKASFSGPSPVNNGTTLGGGFDAVDGLGNTRGADGVWDIGAFESAGSAAFIPPSPPSGLRIQ